MKALKKPQEDPSPTNYQDKEKLIMLKWVFKKFDKNASGILGLDYLTRKLSENFELLTLFGIDPEGKNIEEIEDAFYQSLEELGYEEKEALTFDEFCELAEPHKVQQKRISPALPRSKTNKKSIIEDKDPCCLLDKITIEKLKEIFKELDILNNEHAKRLDFIELLLEDRRIIPLLERDAVRIDKDQTLSLELMLCYIRDNTSHESDYITWAEFAQYFFLADIQESNCQYLHLPEHHIHLLREIFMELPQRAQNKVSTYDLIESLLKNESIACIFSEIARTGEKSSIPEETVEDVLYRIQDEAQTFITWPEFLGYFSKSGTPMANSNASPIRFRYEDPMPDEEVSTDLAFNKSVSSPSKKLQERELREKKESDEEMRLTMPEPFNFETRENFKPKSIRERRVQEMVEAKRK